MCKYLFDKWDQYGFEILAYISIVILIILAFCRIGKKGTYSKKFYYVPSKSKQSQKPKDSKGELICRGFLEQKYGVPFSKARPKFLQNPVTGGIYNLELDCYNPELKLAVEYNGIQHYKYIPYFHKNKEAFLNQKYRDEMKRTKCKENGIRLIEVPYDVAHSDIEAYLENVLNN